MPLHMTSILYIEDIPAEAIRDCSGPGRADEAVAHWRERLGFTVNRERAIRGLAEYGAWEREELAAKGDDDLADIVLWLACCGFAEPAPNDNTIFSLD